MSEERNDIAPRRRRIRMPETDAAPSAADAVNPISGEASAEHSGEAAQTQGPYSRVPEEARRMSASPYGPVNAAAVRHASMNRPDFRDRMTAPHSVRQVRAGADPARSAYQRPARDPQGEPMSRIRVGYAPGRMNEERMSREPAGERIPARENAYSRYQSSAGPMPVRPVSANRIPPRQMPEEYAPQETPRRKGTVLHVLASLLIAAGAFLAVILMLPEENGMRQQLAGFVRNAAGIHAQANAEQAGKEDTPDAGQAGTSDTQDQFASTDDLAALQGLKNHEQPEDAEDSRSETPGDAESGEAEKAGEPAEESGPSDPAESTDPDMNASAQSGMQDREAEPEEIPEAGTEPEDSGNPEQETEAQEAGASETDPEDGEAGASETEPEDGEAGAAETVSEPDGGPEPQDEAAQDDAESGTGEEASAQDDDAEPEAEAKATAPLTAEAVPSADPKLIKTTQIYNGKKQVKEYNRPAKDLIHMPSGWEYTRQQIGVLTFRGNAFRTNGAVGTVESAEALSPIWEAESGSARGSTQTYYGTGWPGQPAIVKWSMQIRQGGNIFDKKKEKEGLKEVVIAGLDGVIRFLDLDTGEITRNSIKLGYPMRGTPSLHPSGYPYMSVGQYARKMKSGTGKIGLRQYNMYNGNEITLIDGTDKAAGRAFSTTGSFETSALIDRTSDTEIAAGSNGLLYLIDLNSDFDWNMNSYKSKQDNIVMRSKASGQKNDKTAVESSLAMYDKYVFYADMGGILRCVDTDFLAPVWAVDTKDAVMAAVALDMRDTDSLDLYTANMLINRKKGDAQVRRFNAMTGKELWSFDIGVKKDKKVTTEPGFKASPVIGENNLRNLVYFTVTGLSDDGRKKLDIAEDAKAALVALEKETGNLRWAYALSDKSESSPIAVYDGDGNGWIIQCAWDGTIVMLDGLSGELISSMEVTGNIEASPAAYNDIMVIGTTGKGTEKIIGIKIGRPVVSSGDQE